MKYDSHIVREGYNKIAEREDRAEKGASFRIHIPREFIKKYLKKTDVVLDAGGGTGINAIMMAKRCQKVTLLDISPKLLELASVNIKSSNMTNKDRSSRG